MSNSRKTENLYNQVIEMVDQSLAVVMNQAAAESGNKGLDSAAASSKALLEGFRKKTNTEIRELRELSEWDTFTIAFYGETNAGKSTLIETLRILLGDKEKLATQQKFNAQVHDLKVDADSILALEKSIEQLEEKISGIRAKTETLEQQVRVEEYQKSAQIQELKAIIESKRNSLKFWQKLILLFRKMEEETALPIQELEFTKFKASNKARLEAIAAEPQRVGAELNARRRDRAQVENSLAQLVPLQDGNIIGNGRSDFTLQSNFYAFEANGRKFQLIDVPGIEGDEKQVMGAIEASVKKAHAVFYVTRAATPPGSGSDGQEGTVDKIKRQLGKQTEVWAIFNKSATNPQVLQGETLINKNDAIGLEDMDKSLTRTLGEETYKGHICVSGMPAFLASATCFIPSNPHAKSRDKFLSVMGRQEILKRSGMDAFLAFINHDICQNFQNKINSSNLKKIRNCIQEGIDHLQEAHKSFAIAAKKLEAQQKAASRQIDDLLSGTSQKLKSECRDQLNEKKTAMRSEIYSYIESDQSNDDFKDYLTNKIENLKTSVGVDLEARFVKVFDAFKYEASEIIKKNQKNVDEILRYTIDDPFSSMKLNFNTDFKMDNGINMVGLISTLGGAAALVWASFLASNPVGWTAAAVLGAVGLVFSFYKAVRSFFSSDYKKEQQRNSANDNLDKVFDKLGEMLENNLESASAKINEALLETKKQMSVPYEQSVNTRNALQGIEARMVALHKKLTPQQTPSSSANVLEAAPAVAP